MYHILLEVDILFGFLSSFGSQKLLQFWLGQRTARLFLHKVKVDFPYRNKILIWVWGSAERTLYPAQDLQYCVTTLAGQLASQHTYGSEDRWTDRPIDQINAVVFCSLLSRIPYRLLQICFWFCKRPCPNKLYN